MLSAEIRKKTALAVFNHISELITLNSALIKISKALIYYLTIYPPSTGMIAPQM